MRSGSASIVLAGPRRLRGLGYQTVEIVADMRARAQANLGKPKGSGLTYSGDSGSEYYGNTAEVWAGGAVTRRACEIQQAGAQGACSRFGLPWGVGGSSSSPTSTKTYPDYATADQNLAKFIAGIQACSIPANRTIPSSWILPAPGGDAPASVKAAYDSYSLRINQELPQAQQNAGAFCGAGTMNGGSTYGAPYGGAPPGAGYGQYGYGAGYGYGLDRYGMPLQSAVTSDPVDIYGADQQAADIYTPTPGTGHTAPEGGTDIVDSPFAPKPVVVTAPPARHPTRTAGIAAGGVVLLAVAFFLGSRRSSRRPRRAS